MKVKGYWLVPDEDTVSVEICFPDREMNTVNACLATLHFTQQEEMLKKLQAVTKDTAPFVLTYEYFTMDVYPHFIFCSFHMFEEPVEFYLDREAFAAALEEYFAEMGNLCRRIKEKSSGSRA